jgi:hypothetical protein
VPQVVLSLNLDMKRITGGRLLRELQFQLLLRQPNKLVAANCRFLDFPRQYADLSILIEVACKSGINRHISKTRHHKLKSNKYPPDNQN